MVFLSHLFYKIIMTDYRAVRAMNESLKQNRLLKEQQDTSMYAFGSTDQHGTDQQKDVCFL